MTNDPFDIYLVGGAVRDTLLGRPAQDRDFVVFGADEAAFLRRFPGARKVGRRSPVYLYRGAEYTLSAAADIRSDLLGRDLTVNALAQDTDGRIWAHPQAREDLRRRLLRPISVDNFIGDPLRVLRLARFTSCWPDFRLHASVDEVVAAVRRSGGLAGVAAERVGREMLKACGSERPGDFMRFLDRQGVMGPWFRELDGASAIPAGPAPYHDESVLEHIAQVMDRLAGDPLRVWMGCCHDLGKTATPADQWPSHHGHERSGEPAARRLAQRLRLPRRYEDAGAAAARWHMAAGIYDQLRVGTRVDLLERLHRLRLVEDLFELVRADRGIDLGSSALADLEVVRAVRLPPADRGQGAQSGQRLRELRCQALARKGWKGK